MKKLLMFTALIATMISACSKDEMNQNELTNLEPLVINDHVKEQMKLAHLNTDDVSTELLYYPDGTSEYVYMLEGDLTITSDQLEAMVHQQTNSELHNRQYSTNNLVNGNQTIKVLGWVKSGNSASLTQDMRTALGWAIDNYNDLNLNLDFDLTIGSTTDFNDYDIVVYQYFNNSAGGSAGFPNNGSPHKWVRIYNLTEGYNRNVIEHVMTHEIGHCLGLRHTDWFSRQSCGSNASGESAGTIGANYISGTKVGYDANSVMLACFDDDEDGEFGYYDRRALRELY